MPLPKNDIQINIPPTKSKRKKPYTDFCTSDYDLIPVEQAHKRRRGQDGPKLPKALQDGAVFALPFGERYVQRNPYVPAPPGCVGVDIALKGPAIIGTGLSKKKKPPAKFDRNTFESSMDMEAVFASDNTPGPEPGRHHRKRANQFALWQTTVIPSVTNYYLQYRLHSESGRLETYHPPPEPPCTCTSTTALRVTLAYWNSKLHRFFPSNFSHFSST